MSAKEELINELLQSRRSPEAAKDEKPKKEPKAKRIPTKEEREAYRQRMIEKEEREALKRMGVVEKKPAGKRGRKKKEEAVPEQEPKKKANEKPKQESTCTKYRPKTVMTMELPDGGSLIITYMPGGSK